MERGDRIKRKDCSLDIKMPLKGRVIHWCPITYCGDMVINNLFYFQKGEAVNYLQIKRNDQCFGDEYTEILSLSYSIHNAYMC